MKTFSTTVALTGYLETVCQKAIYNAASRLLSILQEYIEEEYYDLYEPLFYERTFQFYDSAVANMLSSNSAEILMDDTLMSYTPLWSGEEQIRMANMGFHGRSDIYTPGHYWDVFEEFCNEHAIRILKEELIKQGLHVE